MDFAIGEILARKECDKPQKKLNSLKRSLITAWIDADMMRESGLNAHKRSEAVVKAEGGYIEEKWGFFYNFQ